MTLKELLDISVDTLFNLYDPKGEFVTADWHDRENKSYPDEFIKFLDSEVSAIESSIEYDEESISDDNPTGSYSLIKATLEIKRVNLFMAVLDGRTEITAFSEDKETAKRLACKKKRELYPEDVEGQTLSQIWKDNGIRLYNISEGTIITASTECVK